MIAFVRGPVVHAGATTAVLDVAGVGYELQCTPATAAGLRIGHETTLHATLVVREDSMTLFGFADADERAVFETLQTVTGVGPRLALALLSVHSPDALRRAVAAEDVTALTKVPGVGRKGAQRLVLELKDKLGLPTGAGGAAAAAAPISGPAWQPQVHSALVGLGWSAKEADAAVAAVAEQVEPDADVATVLRLALRSLDRA
ncbi:MAG: Holliday junction branch migration protein RuvA [Candidatus Nanopelagicales bacterium]